MIGLYCFLLAVGSWAVSAFLAETKTGTPFILIFIALGWLFMAIAVGGKKGGAFGVGVLIFAGLAAILFYVLARIPSNSQLYNLKYEGFFLWLGIAGGVFLTLFIPIVVIVKLWKRVNIAEKAAAQKEKSGEKKETENGKLEHAKQVRGRMGVA